MRGIFIVYTEKFPGLVLKAKAEEDKRFLDYAAQPVRSVPVPAPDGNQVVGILNADRKTHLTVAALGSISSPQCHVEVTPGRGVPDKISIVCLTGAAHYILSSNMPQVFDLLLKYGLDPNAVCVGETVLSSVSSVYNEYIAADIMALLMEHGGNPYLVVSGERLFDRFVFLQKAFVSDRGGDCTAAFLRPLHRISCVFSHIHI